MKSSSVSRALLVGVLSVMAMSFASAGHVQANAPMVVDVMHAVDAVNVGTLLLDAQVSPTVKQAQVVPATPQLKGSVMSPSIGRTVIVFGHESNGSKEHPALVNRAWSPTMVNLTVLPDMSPPFTAGSVHFAQTREEALAYREAQGDAQPLVAFWPDRVAG